MLGSITPFAGTSSCTVTLYLNGNTANSSIIYGLESNYTAVFSATSSASNAPAFTYELYVNGLLTATYKTLKGPNSTTILDNIIGRGAGTVTITANSTGGTTNCAVTRHQTITKATPTLALISMLGNFTYNGTKDNSSGLITTVNSQLSAGLYINGKSIGTTTSRLSYLNATAGMYAAVFNTSGNVNYTSYSAKVTSTISKATPNMTLTASPGNFTYNGTSEKVTGNINTISKQLVAIMSVNGVNISSTNVSTYYMNATAGNYTSWFNTSGNQNYTRSSHFLTAKIFKALPDMTLNTSLGNFTYNGTKVVFTASTSSVNNQIMNSKLYINGNYIVSPYSNATAGTYSAVYNTSGNINYSFETIGKTIVISRASLNQNLTVLPAAVYSYNKTTPKIYVNVTGPDLGNQTGLIISLYNGIVYTGLSHMITPGKYNYNFSSLPTAYANVSDFRFYSRFSGNANYTSSNSSVLSVNITDILPLLNIQILNSTAKGVLKTVLFNISSIDNQILGEVELNGTNISNTTTTFYYNITRYNRYDFRFYTLGNVNYDLAAKFLSISLSPSKITPIPTPQPSPPPFGISPIKIQVPIKMLDGTLINTYWSLYFYNHSFIRITTELLPPSNFAYVPLPKNSFGITRIAFASGSYIVEPTIELKQPNSTTCGSKSLKNAFIFFNATDFLNDFNSPIKNITYNFDLNRSFIVGVNKTVKDVVMYRCNPRTMNWTALKTTETSENDTVLAFSSTTLGTSLYGIAFNISNNTVYHVKILTIINTTGLPQGYRYKIKFYNKTQASIAPNPINFYTATYGIYYLKAYTLANTSLKNGSLCTTIYTPNNLPAGFNTTVNAGSVFNINYSNSTMCIAFFWSFRPGYEQYAITIALIVAITFLVAIIYALKRDT
jgi:PGF-pre-PGF domain-containing protein